ncbi:MAG: hypothetical protein ACTSYD_02285 [Candidatus Heimdallarchaeaceae archaeon]
MNMRCKCAIAFDLFRTNMDLIRSSELDPANRRYLILSLIEGIRDIAEDCQIGHENRKLLDEAIKDIEEIKDTQVKSLDELEQKLKQAESKVVRAVIKEVETKTFWVFGKADPNLRLPGLRAKIIFEDNIGWNKKDEKFWKEKIREFYKICDLDVAVLTEEEYLKA